MMQASMDCLTLSLELVSVYAVWLGLMEITQQSGLSKKLAKKLEKGVKKLFKTNNQEAIELICVSMSANFLGLGNIATPSGIEAMRKLDDKTGKINFPMIMLMVLSSCSIQFLPTTMIGLRISAGSNSAYDIILPTLLTSIIATSSAVLLTILINKARRRKNA